MQSRLLEEGAKVGFPVLVKAALGGGGKGMKLAMAEDELEVHKHLLIVGQQRSKGLPTKLS